MTDHPERLKMYLLVRDDVPLGFQVNSIAHAAVGGVLAWLEDERYWCEVDNGNPQTPSREYRAHTIVHAWLDFSFKKVTCVVTSEQFEWAKSLPDAMVFTESDLADKEVAIALKPRYQWPKEMRDLRMFGAEAKKESDNG